MEAKRQRYQYNNYSIDGSNARKLQVIPGYGEPEEIEPIRQPAREKRRKPKADIGIDLFSVLFLTIAIAVTLYTCINYLQVQSDLTEQNKEIAQLEHNLVKLQNQNKDALSQLNTSLDLNYIYKIATKELGMVYPKDNQIITYKSNLSDYVRQYEDIPEENGSDLLDKILN
ncbi:cell division protein FtsL [Anaerocolumna sedimenticola]|uniref:Cell division protein FtsL n=1 Tax=Anaerocolumna sedimenticola TaxID=2696063 RepID=A0A6P1TPB6_9FIRM|nr:septum formation initiator family protein [Anaerocolumna sedimenticola]QHQ62049.1 cell division protein FtsL [Anaerocolumna sedimenticola]